MHLKLTSDHGYSLLRTTLNKDYFYDLYKVSSKMGVEIEGHRASYLQCSTDYHRYGDWTWRVRNRPGVHRRGPHGRQRAAVQAHRQEHGHEAQRPSVVHGQALGERRYSDFVIADNQLSGCSGHIHVSLRDKDGRNIFGLSKEETAAGGRQDAKWKDLQYISQEAEWFLAGLLEGLKDGELT